MKTESFLNRPYVAPAVVVGASIIIGLLVLGLGVSTIRNSGNTLTTTGSHKTHVMSDSAKWTFSVSRTVTESAIQSGYTELEGDMVKVTAFLRDAGVEEAEIETTPILTEEIWNYGNEGANLPRRFTLRQNVTVSSSDVEKITALSKNTAALARTGVFFTNQFPEYYISNLAELRVELLGSALEDAKARASEIARGAGNRVGKLQSATSGVVQVLSPNSLEIADYGAYNTQTAEKDVQVTVRATFKIR